ncbi:hypothetical protein DM01DRAFT_1381820 [Hesseltinella vesiculosa]|uniref:DNA damage-binding protein 1 n=1 Tax=Hesseltinella vesiculosa TaxID=101127 RepID=A0A1X2GP39_9FUNG|nr:hypothetical protein DM01DRAFT_1381820 [Hesseltinella vesiculosa]
MASSRYTCIKTLQSPTAAHAAVKGSFLSATDTNLITSKGTRIEVYSLMDQSLVPVLDFNVFCRIASILPVTIEGRSTCSLFVLGDQQQYCILRYDPQTKSIVTEASHLLEQENARPNDDILSVIDPHCQCALISANTGLLTILPLQSDSKGKGKATSKQTAQFEPIVTKVPEFNIKSIAALDYKQEPMVAVLYEEEDAMWLKFYKVKIDKQPLHEYYKIKSPLEFTSHLLIAVPGDQGAILVVGEYTIGYYSPQDSICVSVDVIMVTSHTFINDRQCLLGDSLGTVYLLTLVGSRVEQLLIQNLGESSISSCLTFLGNDTLYVGSTQGDSKLIQIQHNESNSKKSLKVLDEYPNLSPITDFCLFDLDKQGRRTMVCTSGVHKDGSLRMVQSGIGFKERAVIPLAGVKRVFSASIMQNMKSDWHNALIVSTYSTTRVFYHPDPATKTMKELSTFSTMEMTAPTLAFRSLKNGHIIQITPMYVRLMHADGVSGTINQWQPPPNNAIMVAVISEHCCIVSCGTGHLVCIQIRDHGLVEMWNRPMEHEISALAICEGRGHTEMMVAVGSWDGNSIFILRVSDSSTVENKTLENTVPHSMLFQYFGQKLYLFVSVGDGRLVHYTLNARLKLQDQKTISIGTQSGSLYAFTNMHGNAVFCSSDQPTIINSEHGRLVYSAVNLKDVTGFGLFNNAMWPDSMMLLTKHAVLLGQIDPVRKLHFSKIPLDGKMGRRIAYHDDTQTLLVGTSLLHRDADSGKESNTGWLHVYDARTFQEIGKHDLIDNEVVESLCVARLWDDQRLYVFIGTAKPADSDGQDHSGRVLMFSFGANRRLQLVDAVEVPGVVYCIKPFMQSIAVGVNGSLYYMTSFRPEAGAGQRMTLASKIHTNVLVVDMDAKDDTLLVGDYMQSMSLLRLDESGPNQPLVNVARDFNSNWMTAVHFIDADLYVGAEMSHNVFTLQKPAVNADDMLLDDVLRLDVVGEYHLGDSINRMAQGSLSDALDETAQKKSWSLLYVTVNGAIGTMTGISKEEHDLFLKVQEQILKIQPPIGNMDYNAWRSFRNVMRTETTRNYIDGDLVETYLALSPSKQELVARALECDADQLRSKIENLCFF